MRKCKICGNVKEEDGFYAKTGYVCKRCVCELNHKKIYRRNVDIQPSLDGEIWKPVVGNEAYMVSNLGRVRALSGRLFVPTVHRQGYLRVRLNGKALLIHRLVAEAFIPNPSNKRTVNHINADKSDNRVENLEWATQSENNRHAISSRLRYYTKKMWESQTSGRKLTKKQVLEIKTKYSDGTPQYKLAEEYHVSRSQVCRIVNGKSRDSVYRHQIH